MFAIHGFDEDMLLGWHCDSNLAARLALYRGRVDTLIDKVFGYHCDHTRVAAANNKGRATRMNDQNRFIWDVSSPYLPEQADTWGWPGIEIEEVRLDRETSYERFTSGLAAALDPATEPYRSTSLDWHLYSDLSYDIRHTLPFVCDQVLTYPRSTAVMLVATRAEFVSRFAVAWQAMGFTGPILVPTECQRLDTSHPSIKTGAFSDLVRMADLFVFEFGLATQNPDEAVRIGRPEGPLDKKSLKAVAKLFAAAASEEAETRPKGRRLPRRFIGVNVIYNKFWPLFTDYIGANINPFCSQVLAGIPRQESSLKGKILKFRGRYRV